MGQFIKTRDHNYRDLTIFFFLVEYTACRGHKWCEMLRKIHFLLITRGALWIESQCLQWHIWFLYSLDLSWHPVPLEFNLNAFWYEIVKDYWYRTSACKGSFIRNLYIRVAQWLLACSIFAKDDNLNVPWLAKLYFLPMMNGDRIDLGSFLATQLYSASTSTVGRIVNEGVTTCITRSLGIELVKNSFWGGSKGRNLSSSGTVWKSSH